MDTLTFFPFEWLVQSGFHIGFVSLYAGVAAHTFWPALARVIIGVGASSLMLFLIALTVTSAPPPHPEPVIEPDSPSLSLDDASVINPDNAL